MNKFFILNKTERAKAIAAISKIDIHQGKVVEIKNKTRNLSQNAKFHAICAELSRAVKFANKTLCSDDWKTLLVSAYRETIKSSGELVMGLENEIVQLRRSTTTFSSEEMADLIAYSEAYLASHKVAQ